MPIHDFQHEESGEVISVYVSGNAPVSEHQLQTQNGKVYKRVYVAPRAAKDTRTTECSKDEFRRATDKNGITQGSMWELAREMSERRAEKHDGVDPVKSKFYRDYQREYGVRHTEEIKEEKRRKAEQSREAGLAQLRKMGYG